MVFLPIIQSGPICVILDCNDYRSQIKLGKVGCQLAQVFGISIASA